MAAKAPQEDEARQEEKGSISNAFLNILVFPQ
jgi:hypothetical protein